MSKHSKFKNSTNNFSGNNTKTNSIGNTANSSIQNYTHRPFSRESALSAINVTQENTRTVSFMRETKKSFQMDPSHAPHISQGHNFNNIISANDTLSTAANLKSKLFSRSSRSIDLESAKNKAHHENKVSRAHNIKMEMFDDMEKNFASPKNFANKLEMKEIIDVKGQNAINRNTYLKDPLRQVHFTQNKIGHTSNSKTNGKFDHIKIPDNGKIPIHGMNTISILPLRDHKPNNLKAYKHQAETLKVNSENNVLSYTNKRLLPSVTINDYENFNKTSGSIYSVFPKKLTEKRIEEEKKLLKHYVKSSMVSLDENEIYKNLKLPKSNKNINAMQDFIFHHKKSVNIKKKLFQSIQLNPFSNSTSSAAHQKKIDNIRSNPSLGPEYLRKNYPFIMSKHENFSYDNRFKRNYTKKTFGSVLFAKRVRKEDDSTKYDNVKNTKFTQVSKMKMKWKTIKWILENKKDVLDRLMGFHERILKLSNNKGGSELDRGMTKKEFLQVMKTNGITNDVGLINKLFWMFDEDGDNHLKYKEIAFGIEMFRDSPMEQKLKAFFDLCDVDNSGAISKQEFLELMKKNIISNDEKMTIKQVVDRIFNSVILDKNGEITFEKLKEGCEKNKEIQDIIDKNLLALKSIDHVIDKDIKKDISKFNPELNDQLRMKLLSTRIAFTPLGEEKFARLLDNFIQNREKVIEINKIREVNEDDSIEYQEEDKSLFQEEKDMVHLLNDKWSKEAELAELA